MALVAAETYRSEALQDLIKQGDESTQPRTTDLPASEHPIKCFRGEVLAGAQCRDGRLGT